MRDNVQMGSRGIVLDVVRVAPSEADAALSDASICLLAFGNAGRGSFDSVVMQPFSCTPCAGVPRCSLVVLVLPTHLAVSVCREDPFLPRPLVECRSCYPIGGGNICTSCIVVNGFYLVDPASSHMLVSKIKPCMWGLAGCLPLHHGGSGWCAMGASPNAFSSHPMDVWSVFPWHGGDSSESSVEPNPGRTWPGACWSLGKIRAPRCDMVWHVGCKAEASRERSLVPIGNLGASHDAIISRHERTRVRSSPSAIGAGWHGFFRGGILGDACTRHRCVSRFGTLAKCIKGYHSLRIVPFGNKTWTLRCNPWGVHRETKRDVVALSLGSTCSSWKDAVLGDALTSNRLSRRFTKGRKPR
ncbi:hypothetical protein RIF29_44164 [Crotalaria pallida]|uniref:Uncharacterized protein n=1 Tax=Crotalaria pallida TaxID=3830 RepID=A0AAN9DXB9_CROPI